MLIKLAGNTVYNKNGQHTMHSLSILDTSFFIFCFPMWKMSEEKCKNAVL